MVNSTLFLQAKPFARIMPLMTLCFVFLYSLLLVTQAQALSLTADRSTIPLNETLNLKLTSTQRGLNKVDLSAISKHFEIINRSQQSSYSIVNGRTTAEEVLLLTVAPKSTGSFTIPTLSLGKERTSPLAISVTPAIKAPTELQDKSIFLKSSINKNTALVGEQLIYTLSVYYRVGINDAELNELFVKDATVEPLEEKRYQRQINGRNYQIVEKPYAVFFNQPGDYVITGQELKAILSDGTRSRFGFDPFTRGTTVRLAADNHSVTVKPAISPSNELAKTPGQYSWLPAQELALKDEWSKTVDVPVGEPISRKITLLVKGQHETTLPEFSFPSAANFNVYPEKPTYSNIEWAEGFAVQREETIVYIPTTVGTFRIPAIEIPWYNTLEQQWEIAAIPEQRIIVAGVAAAGGDPSTTSVLPNTNPVAPQFNETNAQQSNLPPASQQGPTPRTNWILLALVTLAWLITLLLYGRERLRSQRLRADLKQKENSKHGDENALLYTQSFSKAGAMLINTCKQNQASESLQQLGIWKKAMQQLLDGSPEKRQMLEQSGILAKLEYETKQLYKHCYKPNQDDKPWDGSDFTDIIHSVNDALDPSLMSSIKQRYIDSNNKSKQALKPLYPDA